jgi:hypothetical protein
VEILVQWLDDFEDLIVFFLLAWERLRLRCIQCGLAAAIVLLAIEVADVGNSLAPTFALAALGSVGIWIAALLYARFLDGQDDRTPVSGGLNA